jgi:hypothetical protein
MFKKNLLMSGPRGKGNKKEFKKAAGSFFTSISLNLLGRLNEE